MSTSTNSTTPPTPPAKVCGRKYCQSCRIGCFGKCSACGFVGCSDMQIETCFGCAKRFCADCMVVCQKCRSKLCIKEWTEDYKCWDCDAVKKQRSALKW